MYNVVTIDDIPIGLGGFPPERYTINAPGKSAQVLIVRSTVLDMARLMDAEAVLRPGDGHENLPLDMLSASGVPAFLARGANARSVAHLALTGIDMAIRNVPAAMAAVQAITTTDPQEYKNTVEKGKKAFLGSLPDGTLGIVGCLGRIGSELARRAIAAGIHVAGYDTNHTFRAALRLSPEIEWMDSLENLLEKSDYVSVHIPGGPENTGFVDEQFLKLMKPDAVLVNLARGGIVDLPSVIAALDNGQLQWYVTDFGHPNLQGRSNVIAFPHLGSGTIQAQSESVGRVIAAGRAYLEDGNIPLPESPNFPALQVLRKTPWRITAAHDDTEGALKAILALLEARHLNVERMGNDSHENGLAYSIMDVNLPVDDATIAEIRQLPRIRRVRYLPEAS